MGEEVKISEYESNGGAGDDFFGDEERVLEWEMGLPGADDLTPLSQPLIPPELASAFSISPGPGRSFLDVARESRNTVSTIRGSGAHSSTNNNNGNNNFRSFADPMVLEPDGDGSGSGSGSDAQKMRQVTVTAGDCAEEADSAARMENSDDPSARTLKRPRLVWTPQLHKRFVESVTRLGINSAVPKTIMQLMNVEGLTRENVASHLQKYRLYLKRMQGLSNEGPSSSDQLFHSSTHESGGGGTTNGHVGMPVHMPYGAPMMPVPVPMPMPVYSHMGMHQGGYHHHYQHPSNGFETNPHGMMQQRDWSGNKLGSVVSYPHHTAPSDKLN